MTLYPLSFYTTNPIQSKSSVSLTINDKSSQFLQGRVTVRYAIYLK